MFRGNSDMSGRKDERKDKLAILRADRDPPAPRGERPRPAYGNYIGGALGARGLGPHLREPEPRRPATT